MFRYLALVWVNFTLVCGIGFVIATAASASVLRTQYFTIEAPDSLQAMGRTLSKKADTIHREVTAQLGTLDDDHPLIHVKLIDGQDELARELKGAAIAEWAAGVAFTDRGLVLLRIDAQTQLNHMDVFRHEISHIALARAVKHRHLPHWFIEGVAVHQAGERLVERWLKASTATLTDSLSPLSNYDTSFPRDGTRADLAYAESTAFLGFLLKRYGWRGIRTLVTRVKRGERFAPAFESLYGGTVSQVERDWRRLLESDASWARIFGDSTVLWTAASVLFIVSWWVQRRRIRQRLAALGALEAEDEFA